MAGFEVSTNGRFCPVHRGLVFSFLRAIWILSFDVTYLNGTALSFMPFGLGAARLLDNHSTC